MVVPCHSWASGLVGLKTEAGRLQGINNQYEFVHLEVTTQVEMQKLWTFGGGVAHGQKDLEICRE